MDTSNEVYQELFTKVLLSHIIFINLTLFRFNKIYGTFLAGNQPW